MKKILLIGNMLAAILFGGFIFLQVPITKLTTESAMTTIDQDFIRTDLDEKERDAYEFRKKWILGNDSAHRRHFSNAWRAGLIFCLLVFISNGTLLIIGARKKSSDLEPQPGDPGNIQISSEKG